MTFDDDIRDAVRTGEAADLAEPSVLAETLAVMRGRHRWMNTMVVVVSTAFLGVAIFALVRLLGTDDAVMSVRWATLLMYASMVIGMLKLWFWLEMQRNSVVREVKRLELEVARLRAGQSSDA